MKFHQVSFLLLLAACSHSQTSIRHLSEDEKLKYNLTGIIHDAEICPTVFNTQTNKHQITGPCEIVNCLQQDKNIDCTVQRPANK